MNNTIFVDPEFGNDTTGQRENEVRPFQTLEGALAIALPNDVIYARPGTYTPVASLLLRDLVDWFFSLGATVVFAGPGGLFTDGGTSVTSAIDGMADFQTTLSGVLFLSGPTSSVRIRGRNFHSDSGAVMFNLPGSEQVTVQGLEFQGTDGAIFQVSSPTANVLFDANRLLTTDCAFANVLPGAIGKMEMRVFEAIGSQQSGLVNMDAADFHFIMMGQLLVSTADTSYIFRMHPISVGMPQLQVEFETIRTLGGGLVQAVSTTPLESGSRINIEAQRYDLTSPLLDLVFVNGIVCDMISEIFTCNAGTGVTLFRVMNSFFTFRSQILVTTLGVPIAGAPVILNLDAAIAEFHVGLVQTNNSVLISSSSSQLMMQCDFINVDVTGQSQTVFDIAGAAHLVIGQMFASASASPGAPTGLGIFDVQSGTSLIAQVDAFDYSMDFIDGFHASDNSQIFLSSKNINNDGTKPNTDLLSVDNAQVFFEAQNVNMQGLATGAQAVVALKGDNANVTVLLGVVNTNGFHTAFRLLGQNSTLNGYVSEMNLNNAVSTARAIFTQSDNLLYLTFDAIRVNFDGVNAGASVLEATGNSSNFLIGADVQVNGTQTAFLLTGSGSRLNLNVVNMNINDADIVCEIDSSNGGAVIHIENLSGSQVRTSAFLFSDGVSSLSGNNFTVFDSVQTPTGVHVDGNARVFATVNYCECGGPVAHFSTNNEAWFTGQRLITDGGNEPVIRISAPGPGLGEYVVSGYMRTPHMYAIELTGPDVPLVLRLLSSILVSVTNCIFSTNAVTVVIAPSSAKNFPAGTVTIVPLLALFVDGGVN